RTLPYLPRISYRRTVLSPARWRLSNSDADASGQNGNNDSWAADFTSWRDRWRVPARVVACSGDLRLPVDLDNPRDLMLVRRHLGRTTDAVLQEDLAPDGGWLGRPTEFLATFTTRRPRRPDGGGPRRSQTLTLQPPPGTGRPGACDVLVAHLPCNPVCAEDLLDTAGGFLNRLEQRDQPTPENTGRGKVLRWWARRDHDPLNPGPTHRISLFLKLSAPEAYGEAAAALGGFGADLAARNLPHLFTLAPYNPHEPRYGGANVFPLVEAVFAADTAAALAQTRLVRQATGPSIADVRAVTAASMAAIAGALAPEGSIGYGWLAEDLRGHTAPVEHAVTAAARNIVALDGSTHPLHDAAWVEVTRAWAARSTALANYRDALVAACGPGQGAMTPHEPARRMLRSLLHEHVRRAIGTDPDLERQANHAARSVALSLLAQGSRP
ncbi:MAG: thiopeptide-type bacteriocin biosynthesis protein, partial [Pseudonocardiaceae bacterium]